MIHEPKVGRARRLPHGDIENFDFVDIFAIIGARM
jgi:hypothetical protein